MGSMVARLSQPCARTDSKHVTGMSRTGTTGGVPHRIWTSEDARLGQPCHHQLESIREISSSQQSEELGSHPSRKRRWTGSAAAQVRV